MRKSKFTERQIIGILKEIEDGAPIVETLREKGVSKDTYYKWKRKYTILNMKIFSYLYYHRISLKKI